ncbi:MAG: hypothetical protein CMO97_02080 [Woeseia sp.]|nr:hypothetical protein [Woeseia sp.]
MVEILAIIGATIAGASVISNDAVQTLGTFMSSNKSTQWWKLWIAASLVAIFTILWSWFNYSGDITFGRLDKIPLVEIQWYHIAAPVILLSLTRFGIPVSTTFLVLSVFSTGVIFEKMLVKSVMGYAIAAVSAYLIWVGVSWLINERKKIPTKQERVWRTLQWITTGFLWFTWLSHDLANIAVFLPRQLDAFYLSFVLILVVSMLALIFYQGGGKIQDIVSSKSSTRFVRSATIVDFVYAAILLVFKEWSNVPMSTTWVFVGLLCGRELAIATWHKRKAKRVLPVVVKDLMKVFMGLAVSVVLVVVVQFLKGELN